MTKPWLGIAAAFVLLGVGICATQSEITKLVEVAKQHEARLNKAESDLRRLENDLIDARKSKDFR